MEGKQQLEQIEKEENENKKENLMREIGIEKVILNIGGAEDKLEKGFLLLQKLTGRKPIKIKAKKRIPAWGVRLGLEVGTKVTLRGKDGEKLLKKLLPAIDNTLKEKQIKDNFFSFGIHEYIEIPDVDYIRDVGIMGFEVCVVFSRAGKRIERKRIKKGKTKRQIVSVDEIKNFMIDKFKTEIKSRRKK
jgi:large subunit ribosomal protein L5